LTTVRQPGTALVRGLGYEAENENLICGEVCQVRR
jgi:transcription initiation factor IIE alpha subunit